MRLLDVTTKRLESFYGDKIPEYAILSHMWGDEKDEVLFKHVAGSDDDRREGKERKGYLKLSAACKQAGSDGWEYIWIDTCCINKESSAELSEAINSMYAWYQSSEVCYAYLEDMKHEAGIPGFKESRWFTRGWTLQELIAPRRVVFYSSDWTDIGTKASLRHVISSVTGIRIEMITSYNPNKASVAEKMSWAAKRETTRAEDIAYCLMGLLGVNMPLLYGEGKRAFMRLQEEIMKVSDDHSIFAWSRYGRFSSSDYSSEAGMLADSPLDFHGAGNVVKSNNDDGPYLAYSMSNRGLQITLPIQPIDPDRELCGVDLAIKQNIFRAILDCTYRDTSPTQWVVIYLKMVGKGRYVRALPFLLNDTMLDPSEANRYRVKWVVTSLVVPQINTSTINLDYFSPRSFNLKILPTESGYSYKGESLVKGGHDFRWGGHIEFFIFSRKGKRFGVVTEEDRETIWMDVITEDDFEKLNLLASTNEHDVIEQLKPCVIIFVSIDPRLEHTDRLYEDGGSRCYAMVQYSNSLCMSVSKGYSVDVSGKLASIYDFSHELTIDIRADAVI